MYVASKLDISVETLQGYLNQENRIYKDYKNQMGLYNIGAKILRKFGFEKGGKR